jgi:hypothetical protein
VPQVSKVVGKRAAKLPNINLAQCIDQLTPKLTVIGNKINEHPSYIFRRVQEGNPL